MARVRALALVLAAATPAAAAPIIGGTQATASDFPAVGALEIDASLCTGELIQPDWMVTAAHCLDPAELGLGSQADVTAKTTAVLGATDISAAGATKIAAAETFVDPQWDHQHFGKHDLALVHLATPYTAVPPLVLNFKPSYAPVGVEVTMVGFGTTTAGATATAGVEYELAGQKSEACSDFTVAANATIDDADLLCFTQAHGQGTCAGDSGGPLIATYAGAKMVIGLTSFGDQQCTQYGAYTRTDAEIDFVKAHLPALCDNGACVDPAVSGGCAAGGGGGLPLAGLLLATGAARTRGARRTARARAARRDASPACG